MIQKPRIAVIVPNWNDSAHVSPCLRAVLEQESPPDELIVVDDASTDNSVEVIESAIAGNNRAQLLVNETNLGVYGAVDVGLRHIQSEYVHFLSANDFVLPGIYVRAKACFEKYPAAGLWSAMAWLVDEQNAPIRLHASPIVALRDRFFSAEECIRLIRGVGNWFTGSTLIYRRDAVHEAGSFDPAYGGMSDLITAWIIASRHGVGYSPEPLAAFRIHKGSYSSTTLGNAARLEVMLERLGQRGPQLSPQLFSADFVDRVTWRFRFAGARVSGAVALAEIAGKLGGWRGAMLQMMERLVPAGWLRLRVAIAYILMLPFDLMPAFWNRFLGGALIRARLYLGDRGHFRAGR